jgi:hypothetical protein
MDPLTSVVTPIEALEIGALIAEGGNSKLYGCTVGGRPSVYKQFDAPYTDKVDFDALAKLVQWPRQLDERRQKHLETISAWPTSIVVTDQGPSGILIPTLPNSMFYRRNTDTVLRHLDRLGRSPRAAEALNAPFYEPPARLMVLGRLISAVRWFHHRSVVIVDVQEENTVFDKPRGNIVILDCDSMQGPWGQVSPPVAPLNYASALASLGPTPAGDYCRLALLIIRVLQEDFGAEVPDRAILAKCMTSDAIDLLARSCDGEAPRAEDTALWGRLGALWSKLGTSNGALYVQTDSGLRPWQGAAIHIQAIAEEVPSLPLSLPSGPIEDQPPVPMATPHRRRGQRYLVWGLAAIVVAALVLGFFYRRGVFGTANPPATGTVSRTGLELVASDGGVFAFGAPYLGNAVGKSGSPIVGMAADPQGRGYWLVASDGGVFAFGAPYLGNADKTAYTITGIAADPQGRGYWIVAGDGGVFALGVPYLGNAVNMSPNYAITGIGADPEGRGYWLVGSDGGIFAFGAPFLGNAVGMTGHDVVQVVPFVATH